jgi:predicted HTH domain antitoxin
MVHLEIPEALLQYGVDKEEAPHHLIQWWIISLFCEGHISSGKAAQLLNISRMDFINLLSSRGISFPNYTQEELREELDAAELLSKTKLQ